jgi:hypothetical protein
VDTFHLTITSLCDAIGKKCKRSDRTDHGGGTVSFRYLVPMVDHHIYDRRRSVVGCANVNKAAIITPHCQHIGKENRATLPHQSKDVMRTGLES